ncbi:MAG: hypothetical protein OEM81_07750 [Acidimicrobiia bacterium]|nr:hypothetical protein [Acidimicrobiia bacterium]MDH3397707.1 hypothetical protein [Acidimicrobiia bacterium]
MTAIVTQLGTLVVETGESARGSLPSHNHGPDSIEIGRGTKR